MCIHDHGLEWECSGCIANALELRWSYAGVCVVIAVWRCHRPLGRWRHGFHFIPYAMRKDSMKPISYKSSKAAAVCSVTSAPCVDFPLRYLMWFPNILVKKYMNVWIQQELKRQLISYFRRYYLIMQHQRVVERVDNHTGLISSY